MMRCRWNSTSDALGDGVVMPSGDPYFSKESETACIVWYIARTNILRNREVPASFREELERRGSSTVMEHVDGTSLSDTFPLVGPERFDVVIFNFPYGGAVWGARWVLEPACDSSGEEVAVVNMFLSGPLGSGRMSGTRIRFTRSE